MPRGRPQREPMERLVRIAAALSEHPRYGVPVERLVEIAGFADDESGRRQLQREIDHLGLQGWQIENVSPAGTDARYRMVTLDNRLKLRLTPAQSTALQRAAILARRTDLLARLGIAGEPPDLPAVDLPLVAASAGGDAGLGAVLEAVRLRAALRFRYKGAPRMVHPQSVTQHGGMWYLRAVEDDGDQVKTFLVDRMGDLDVLAPGSARRVPVDPHVELHPLRWEIDPPIEVTLRVEAAFRGDVVRLLLEPAREHPHADGLELRYCVTHRAAFRDRVYELGTRVQVVGPAEMREELLAELVLLAGDAP